MNSGQHSQKKEQGHSFVQKTVHVSLLQQKLCVSHVEKLTSFNSASGLQFKNPS